MDYDDKWIGVGEAAKYLGVSKETLRNWIKQTDIPARKVGRCWKFKKMSWMSGLRVDVVLLIKNLVWRRL